jgi:5-carboxymethyl-2-hydroxymuconate isomerase
VPHLVLEYSANMEPELDAAILLSAVHEAALATGIFPIGGVRTRAQRRTLYWVADGHPDNRFVHLDMRIAAGRPVETRKRAGDAIFKVLTGNLASQFELYPIGISMEIAEINSETSWKQNNLHESVAERARTSSF